MNKVGINKQIAIMQLQQASLTQPVRFKFNCLTKNEPNKIPTPADGTKTEPHNKAAVEAAKLNCASKYLGIKVIKAVIIVNSQEADKVTNKNTLFLIRLQIVKGISDMVFPKFMEIWVSIERASSSVIKLLELLSKATSEPSVLVVLVVVGLLELEDCKLASWSRFCKVEVLLFIICSSMGLLELL